MDARAAYSLTAIVNEDEAVNRFADMVKRAAYHIAGRLPPSVQVEDLIQAGMIGLLEALRNYKTSRGASFATYAVQYWMRFAVRIGHHDRSTEKQGKPQMRSDSSNIGKDGRRATPRLLRP